MVECAWCPLALHERAPCIDLAAARQRLPCEQTGYKYVEDDGGYMYPTQAAALLGVDISALYRLLTKGKVEGAIVWIDNAELDRGHWHLMARL